MQQPAGQGTSSRAARIGRPGVKKIIWNSIGLTAGYNPQAANNQSYSKIW